MKRVTLLLLLPLISNLSIAQVHLQLSPGLGSVSGGVVYPYEGSIPNPIATSPIEIEIQYDLKERFIISSFYRYKLKHINTDILGGATVKTHIDYIGLKGTYRFPKDGFEIGTHLAYGFEKIPWKNSDFNIFEPDNNIQGMDKFQMVQAGLDFTYRWPIFDRCTLSLTLSTSRDFIIVAERTVEEPDQPEYGEFDYKGAFSGDFKFGFGYRLF